VTFVVASEDTISNISFQILPLHLSKNQARDPHAQALLHPIAFSHLPRPCLDASRRVAAKVGGGERNRTDDLLLAKQALSQLSYTPNTGGQARIPAVRECVTLFADTRQLAFALVGQGGFEPPTSRLSSARSNQLSY
jgi:hypothetical protein